MLLIGVKESPYFYPVINAGLGVCVNQCPNATVDADVPLAKNYICLNSVSKTEITKAVKRSFKYLITSVLTIACRIFRQFKV